MDAYVTAVDVEETRSEAVAAMSEQSTMVEAVVMRSIDAEDQPVEEASEMNEENVFVSYMTTHNIMDVLMPATPPVALNPRVIRLFGF